jgi:hypothetical protein
MNEEVRDVLNGIVDGGIDTWVEVIKDIYKYGILEKSGSLCIANSSGDVAYEDVWIYLVFGSSDLTDMCHEHMHTSNNA